MEERKNPDQIREESVLEVDKPEPEGWLVRVGKRLKRSRGSEEMDVEETDLLGGDLGMDNNSRKGMSRRQFLKTAGAVGVTVATEVVTSDVVKAAVDKIGKSEELRQVDEFPVYREGGWDRIQVREGLFGEAAFYKDFDTLAQGFDELPEVVVQVFDERLSQKENLSNNEFEAAVEQVLEIYNRLRQKGAVKARELRQDYHQSNFRFMSAGWGNFFEASSHIEDMLAGREAEVTTRNIEQFVTVLEQIWLLGEDGFEKQEAIDRADEIEIKVTRGEAEGTQVLSDDEMEETLGFGRAAVSEMVSRYPVGMLQINEVNFVMNIDEKPGGEAKGMAHYDDGRIETQLDEGAVATIIHEDRHFVQPNRMLLFDGENRINDQVAYAALPKTLELIGVALDGFGKIVDLAPDLDEVVRDETIMKYGGIKQSKGFYEALLDVVWLMKPDKQLSGIDIALLQGKVNKLEGPVSLDEFEWAREPLLEVMKRMKGRNTIPTSEGDGEITPELQRKLEGIYQAGFNMIIHFLVDPPAESRDELNLDGKRAQKGSAEDKLWEVAERVDAHWQEWMSAGQYNVDEILEGKIYPYGALVIVLAGKVADEALIAWTHRQLTPEIEGGIEREYLAQVEEVRRGVEPLLNDERSFDQLWSEYLVTVTVGMLEGSMGGDGQLVEGALVLKQLPYLDLLTEQQANYVEGVMPDRWKRLVDVGLV